MPPAPAAAAPGGAEAGVGPAFDKAAQGQRNEEPDEMEDPASALERELAGNKF